MTTDEVLAFLAARAEGFAALARGDDGDLLAFAAALVPGTDPEAIVAALATVTRSGRTDLVRLEGTDDRPERLAFATAVARHASLLDSPQPWTDALDDVRYDCAARPHAYRDLSPMALALAEALDLPETSDGGRLLFRLATAALDAAPPEQLADARTQILALRRTARLQRWRSWLTAWAGTPGRALRDAIDALEAGEVPLAASDGPPPALARLFLGEALAGEVTLAVAPGGVVVEWDGEGPPPDEATLGRTPLDAAAEASSAPGAWMLRAPPAGSLRLTLARGGEAAVLTLGAPA
ncbi:MAG: hypothetical protein H6732_10550 [Alphaproteobacteria bacterium]|nr:hypothetical protein [Alphaproteobacteria bacterium]